MWLTEIHPRGLMSSNGLPIKTSEGPGLTSSNSFSCLTIGNGMQKPRAAAEEMA